MAILTIFIQMLSLCIMIGAGFILSKAEILDQHTSGKMSKMILTLFNPMLALANAVTAVGTIPIARLGLIALLASGMYIIFIIIGALLSRFFSQDVVQRRMYQLCFAFPNVGFIGIPVVSCVLGAEYVIYVTMFSIVFNIFFYTYGLAVMDGEFSIKALKAMLTPANGIILLSVLVIAFEWHFPSFVNTAITYLGNCASPMALLTVGYTIAHAELGKVFSNYKLYVFSAVRLLIMPVIFFLCIRWLPIDHIILTICVILAGMPVANMPLILGMEKGIDCSECSASIIMTTILCIITVPIIMMLV